MDSGCIYRELHSYNHISLLFVAEDYHRKGIAKKLLKYAVKKCIELKSELEAVDVFSCPYAVDIYKKMGFVQTDNEQVKNGIRFVPMILKLN